MLNLSFYLTIFLLSLGQFTSIYKNGESSVYLFDVSVLFFSFFGLIYFLLVKRSFKLPRFSLLFLLFTLTAVCSLVSSYQRFSFEEIITSSFYLIRWVGYLLGSIVVFNMIDKGLMTKDRVVNTFVLSGALISIVGFIQLLILPDFSVLDPSLGWDPHKNRLASSFFDPNFTGAYLVICLTVLFDRFYSKGKVKKIDLLLFLIMLTALFLTFSRSAWGMLVVVVLVYGFFKSKVLLASAIFIAFMAYFAIPRIQTRISGITDPADSASLRIASWRNTIEVIKDNMMLGVGFNTFRYVQKEYGFLNPETLNIHSGSGSDSSLLLVWASTGILGFGIFLASMVFPVYESIIKNYPQKLVIISIILGLLLECLFINSLFYPQIMFVFLSLLFIL
ncbi:MAG: O-antigen ligase family protein [Patescibacteria group bacterium]